MKSKIIRVYGKVQGVGYRAFAKRQAESLGVNGIVRNHYDGSVYIEAEGNEEALKHFVESCRKGPYWSGVTKVDEEDGMVKNFSGFQIVR